jgi:isochorismate synthase
MTTKADLQLELPRYSHNTLINAVLAAGFHLNYAVIVWRLPGDKSIRILISSHQLTGSDSTIINQSVPGFVLNPFNNDSNNQSFFLPMHWELNLSSKQLKSFISGKEHSREFVEVLCDQIKHSRMEYLIEKNLQQDLQQETLKNDYMDAVKKSVDEIAKNNLSKVVLARTKHVKFSELLDMGKVYKNLCHRNLNAFVAMIALPPMGLWLCATPELLLETTSDGSIRTMSLAGTRKKTGVVQIPWGKKELDEQLHVSAFIEEVLSNSGVVDYRKNGPLTRSTGIMEHIQTEYIFNPDNGRYLTFMDIAKKLHHSPAICGTPKAAALDFINENESFNREYFCGYLGPVNTNNFSKLFINIRCIQIWRNLGVLYAGAGITIDSDPSSEWEETNLKCETILNALNL